MYHYGIERKQDAIRHAVRQPHALIRWGDDTIFEWDAMYGVINERIDGKLVARHVPTLDGATRKITGWRRYVPTRDGATGKITGWRRYGPDLTQGPQDLTPGEETMIRFTCDDTVTNALDALCYWTTHPETTIGYQTRGSVQDFVCGPVEEVVKTYTLSSPEEVEALIGMTH